MTTLEEQARAKIAEDLHKAKVDALALVLAAQDRVSDKIRKEIKAIEDAKDVSELAVFLMNSYRL